VKETLERLIELQRLDQALVELRARIDQLHRGLSGAQTSLAAAETRVAAAHHELQESQAALHSHEVDLQTGEQKVRDLSTKLNNASSNAEFKGLQLEIGTWQAENGKLEERILIAMDDVEEKERVEDAAKAARREAEAGLRAAEALLEEQRQGLESEYAALEERRATLGASIDAEKLRLYERIRAGNVRSGTAVVPVHGEYCQGCQMAVRPQDIADLVKGEKLILCRTCQRILVLEP